jgi:hypothetical protein
MVFDLRRLETGDLIHRYATEGAALPFVRDVVRIGGHEQAARFALEEQDPEGNTHAVDGGADLVRRALQDRAT